MDTEIRRWKIKDAPSLVNILNNKNVQENLTDGLPYPFTLEDANKEISGILKMDPNIFYRWAIIVDGNVAGRARITRKDNVHRYTAELGYDLAEDYWGMGIASKAVKIVCDWVMENTDIMRIFAQPYDFNPASCKVLEKAGFVFEGSMKYNAYKNGKHVATQMYSLTRK